MKKDETRITNKKLNSKHIIVFLPLISQVCAFSGSNVIYYINRNSSKLGKMGYIGKWGKSVFLFLFGF